MSDIKRYDSTYGQGGLDCWGEMQEDKDGDYVSYKDLILVSNRKTYIETQLSYFESIAGDRLTELSALHVEHAKTILKLEAAENKIKVLEVGNTMTDHLKTDWEAEKKRLFLEGFKVSGDGYNSEYLKGSDPTDEVIWKEIEKAYKEVCDGES